MRKICQLFKNSCSKFNYYFSITSNSNEEGKLMLINHNQRPELMNKVSKLKWKNT